jgi:hypothetical protein
MNNDICDKYPISLETAGRASTLDTASLAPAVGTLLDLA